jgi:N-acetylglutamate synthase-like GNAT family acetyltransferase
MTDVFKILTLQDYGKVVDVFQSIFPEIYRKEFDMVWMLRHTELSLGMFDKNVLKGFILCRQLEEGHLRIEFLGVNPKVQKEGIGTMLLKHVLQFATDYRISLIPVEDSRIIKWYQKFGFCLTGNTQVNPFTGELEEIMIRSPHSWRTPSAPYPCQPEPSHTSSRASQRSYPCPLD